MQKPPKMSAYQKLHSKAPKPQDQQPNNTLAARKEIKQRNASIFERGHTITKTSGGRLRPKGPIIHPKAELVCISREGTADSIASIRVYNDRLVYDSKSDNEEDADDKIRAKPTIKSRSRTFVEKPKGRGQSLSPMMKNKEYDNSDDSSVDDTITTAGAKLTLSTPARGSSVSTTSLDDEGDGDALVVDDGISAEAESGSGSGNESANTEEFSKQILARGFPVSDDSEPSRSEDTLVQAPGPKQVPDWFPKNIKKICKIDHHGGALTFKELDEITRYRASLQITHRRKWKKYIEAGQARWKLQQVLHKLRVRPMTKGFYAFRKKQYTCWREEALRRWKRLEKVQHGALFLDEKINTNFLMERMIYRERLDGGQER